MKIKLERPIEVTDVGNDVTLGTRIVPVEKYFTGVEWSFHILE